jgi:hypothetical protein
MSRITKKTLERTVLELALDVASESAAATNNALAHSDGVPSKGTLVEVTELDRRLWKAAIQLKSFKSRRPTKRTAKRRSGVR